MPFTDADPAHDAEVRAAYPDTVVASGVQETWHPDGLLEVDPEEALFWLLAAVDREGRRIPSEHADNVVKIAEAMIARGGRAVDVAAGEALLSGAERLRAIVE